MEIIQQINAFYACKVTESEELWLSRVIGDFLNLEEVPLDKPLIAMGATSLSTAILRDLILQETKVSLSLDELMNGNSISMIAEMLKKQKVVSL